MKLTISLLGVALALCPAGPLAAQTLTAWDSPVRVVLSDGALTKSAGCEGCPDAGAQSVTQLTGDGFAEFLPAANARIVAGLSSDLSAATEASTIDYAFSLWPGGAWEVRERGVYRTDGAMTAGDRFRVSIESGRVVYRKNGAVVYTSATAPSYPLALDTTLFSMDASLSEATVVITTTVPVATAPPPPPPVTAPSGPPVVGTVGPYQAVTDRFAHAKPSVPLVGPAGSSLVDPVFKSLITRITDGSTRTDTPGRSYRTPSSPHQNAWSATGSRFYLVAADGSVLPYTFNARTGSAARVQPAASGSGGLVLSFYVEPQFSYVRDEVIYGSYSGPGATLRTVDQYDFTTASYSRLIDLDTLVPDLAGTYIGGIASSAGSTERLMTVFGGPRQDLHHYVVVFDAANPQNRHLLDTSASTINGNPTGVPLNFLLHHAMMDRSGRYVMLYPTSADQAGPRKAPQSVVWDTETNLFTGMPVSSLPYGHDAFGYGVSVNQDCCVATSWDAAQWQLRSLASPLATREVITTVLSPQQVYLAEHSTWNNAQPDRLVPFVSGLYRYGANTTAWRAWDDEIVAVQTDAAPGADATVWRFAHHRSNVASDLDATRTSFWYMPRPNVSPDGRWVLFTSNWEKTLGTDLTGEPGAGARQDVFLVELTPSVPPPPPVAIGATSLAAGRATVPYATELVASGGHGAFRWAVTSGALPSGLTLHEATGAIAGTPSSWGASAFTVTVADALDSANAASADFAISVMHAPIAVTPTAPATARLTLLYSGGLTATGGSGAFVWSVTGGALAPGLTLNVSTGAISGMPVAMGIYTATVTVADEAELSNAAIAEIALTVGAPPVRATTAALPEGRAKNYYSAMLAAEGGSGVFTWSAAGALPAGLALNATTGAISGMPKAGAYTVTVTVTDVADATNLAAATYSITIAAAVRVVSPKTIPVATVGVPYVYAVLAANVQGTVKWDVASGEMPPGMTLDPATGVISGTCFTAGLWHFNARVKDASTDHTLTLNLKVE